MHLFEWATKLGVTSEPISEEEWDKFYNQTYNTLSISDIVNKHDLLLFAEDIIFIHELRKAGYDGKEE